MHNCGKSNLGGKSNYYATGVKKNNDPRRIMNYFEE